jgi:hypothetical protein
MWIGPFIIFFYLLLDKKRIFNKKLFLNISNFFMSIEIISFKLRHNKMVFVCCFFFIVSHNLISVAVDL